jgi:hypothetical protein
MSIDNVYIKYLTEEQKSNILLNTDTKKLVFLLGVKVEYLIKIQLFNLDNNPFRKYLNRIDITYNTFVELNNKVDDLLRKYKITYTRLNDAILLYTQSFQKSEFEETSNILTIAFNLGIYAANYLKILDKEAKEQEEKENQKIEE